MRKFLLWAMGMGLTGAAALADPPVSTGSVPAAEAPAPASAGQPPEKAAPPQPIKATLNDGSKIEIDADGSVWELGADGSKNETPDGTLTLRDGTPFVVKDGKWVAESN